MSTFNRLRPTLRATSNLSRIHSQHVVRALGGGRLASTHALVFLEHSNGVVEPASLSALAAASKLGSGDDAKITGIVIGSKDEVEKVLPTVKKLPGLSSVLHSSSALYSPPLPETLTPLFKSVLTDSKFTHFFSAHSSAAKSILPRVAAVMDLPAVSDVTSVEHSSADDATTFTRPIYAGNAIATVRAGKDIPLKIVTVRATSFAPLSDGASAEGVEVKEFQAVEENAELTKHLETSVSTSDRPDLGTAKKVVSGGRALKNKETFQKTLEPLAEVLGAAVGASRAAVDAGYADNSLQVGQTGKIVAPELYMAIGISGAIQHLAGMKDSKMIVAINKDPDAPIFQVADVGLVGDLYDIVPELTEKLK
ncbi:Probable electron transfer flavoprotein subunit alpha, mitochondrial Short=Alpha-ETF; Flags: Precursor [Serendipita indica DSM 11827]|nr:Probable electron transfer flavoprotein subunit alpha, mitochondrial Short=Alpha-ETF; Flags: Precursor [Serendipita indica DSM 11827]